MKKYSIGFAFRNNNEEVLLIEKNRPAWMMGALNGVGGHIEEGEGSGEAMVREFLEETGVQTQEKDWRLYCNVHTTQPGDDEDSVIYFFHYTPDLSIKVSQTTDEKLIWLKTTDVWTSDVVLVDLKWLIPMALDFVQAFVVLNCKGG